MQDVLKDEIKLANEKIVVIETLINNRKGSVSAYQNIQD